jgi:imidazole glycerol phosphate synthase subunit HisF
VEIYSIPVIASSREGKVEDFAWVFEKTDMEVPLVLGLFHRVR